MDSLYHKIKSNAFALYKQNQRGISKSPNDKIAMEMYNGIGSSSSREEFSWIIWDPSSQNPESTTKLPGQGQKNLEPCIKPLTFLSNTSTSAESLTERPTLKSPQIPSDVLKVEVEEEHPLKVDADRELTTVSSLSNLSSYMEASPTENQGSPSPLNKDIQMQRTEICTPEMSGDEYLIGESTSLDDPILQLIDSEIAGMTIGSNQGDDVDKNAGRISRKCNKRKESKDTSISTNFLEELIKSPAPVTISYSVTDIEPWSLSETLPYTGINLNPGYANAIHTIMSSSEGILAYLKQDARLDSFNQIVQPTIPLSNSVDDSTDALISNEAPSLKSNKTSIISSLTSSSSYAKELEGFISNSQEIRPVPMLRNWKDLFLILKKFHLN